MANKNHELHFTYPPDFQKSKKHRLATRIFKGLDKQQTGEECECCERKVGAEQTATECCYDTMKLAFLGPGIPLLFSFIRNSIILLLTMLLVFVFYNLYSNFKGGFCSQQGMCSGNVLETFAVINKMNDQDYLTAQNYTLLAFVAISIFVMHYFRYNFRRVQDESDDMITSPSDYALILRRLPQDTSQADVQKMIQDRRKQLTPEQIQVTQNLKVVNIVLAFSMSEYTRVKQQNRQQFIKLLGEEKHNQFQPKPMPKLDKTASFAIIIFSRQQSKQFFKYKANIFQKILQFIWAPCIPRSHFLIKGQRIAVERAPEPDDIVWQNSKISMKGAICRKTVYSLLSIMLLIGGGASLYGLAVAQQKASQDQTTQIIMSTFFSILVSIINFIIELFLIFTSKKQRNQTITQFNTVLMVKISLFQFLNTGVFVIIAKFLANPSHFSLTDGLVFQITQVMILNAFIPNITLFLLNYCEIVPRLKRCLMHRGAIKSTQFQANMIYEGPPAEIPYKYAFVFKTIWLAAFYAPLVPIVVPISILGLGLNYAIEKLLFSKIYAAPNMMSSMVNDSAIQFLQYVALFISLGDFIVFLYFQAFQPNLLPQYWSIPIYVSIALSIVNQIVPMDVINKKIFKMPSDNFIYPSYEEVDQKFQVTYEMTNPGYVCNRKRKRDVFIFNKLFGQQMTVIGLAGQNKNESLLTGQQNIYGNNNGNNNQSGNNRQNNDKSNPFNALFNPMGQSLNNPENNQTGRYEENNENYNQFETVKNENGEQNKKLIQNKTFDKTQSPGENGQQNEYKQNQEEKEQNECQDGAQFKMNDIPQFLTNPVKKKSKPAPPPPQFGFPVMLPPGFNTGYFNASYTQFQNKPLTLKDIKLRTNPIPIAPESDSSSSYDSVSNIKKKFKIPNGLHPFTQIEFEDPKDKEQR